MKKESNDQLDLVAFSIISLIPVAVPGNFELRPVCPELYENYENMLPSDAIRKAIDEYPGGLEAVANKMGITPQKLKNKFNTRISNGAHSSNVVAGGFSANDFQEVTRITGNTGPMLALIMSGGGVQIVHKPKFTDDQPPLKELENDLVKLRLLGNYIKALQVHPYEGVGLIHGLALYVAEVIEYQVRRIEFVKEMRR